MGDDELEFTWDIPYEQAGMIRDGVTSVRLKRQFEPTKTDSLGEYDYDYIDHTLEILPPTVTSLDLSGVYLGNFNQERLSQTVNKIPQQLSVLNLSHNHLHTDGTFVLVCGGIRARYLKHLSLANNQLGELWLHHFEQAKTSIYGLPEIETIDLSHNDLKQLLTEEETPPKLNVLLQQLPKTCHKINLAHNGLGQCSAALLVNFVKNLPKQVTELDLSGNDLSHKDMTAILAACPRAVTIVGDPYAEEKPVVQPDMKDKIRLAVVCAVDKYARWYNTRSNPRGEAGWFTSWRHGKAGQEKAVELQKAIESCDTAEDMIQVIDTWLSAKSTRYHTHSLASFALDELRQIAGSKWEKMTPDQDNHYTPYNHK